MLRQQKARLGGLLTLGRNLQVRNFPAVQQNAADERYTSCDQPFATPDLNCQSTKVVAL